MYLCSKTENIIVAKEFLRKHDNAMIIGKFLPMHKGHKALVEYALKNAHITNVFVLAHQDEYIPMDTRIGFIKDEFAQNQHVNVYGVAYDKNELNQSSESDLDSSIAWSEYLKPYITKHNIDVIVGSELYVKYMGEYLGIDYIIYDEHRTNIQISATKIREDLINNWDYLVPSVKRYYAHHICVCGSESTGKTTTCSDIEKSCPGIVTMIPEIGRCLVGNAKTCEKETLKNVLDIHRKLLLSVIENPPTPIILWDTDNYTTLSYYMFLFGEKLKNDIYPKANKYFFFDSNIPYIKDATRMEMNASKALSRNHFNMYKENNIELEKVSENRSKRVLEYINKTLTLILKKFNGYDIHI